MLLFDPDAKPQSWNERLQPNEFAVLYYGPRDAQPLAVEGVDAVPDAPFCTVFPTLDDAEGHAREQVRRNPELECRIYDETGLGGPPLREISGLRHKKESEISPRFRRWGGSVLFGGGLALVVYDWSQDFSLTWPATIGLRLLPAGLVLLITEAVLVWSARRRRAADNDRLGKT